ncbi:ras-related protein Rab-1A, putative [Entamoeba histolytica HM-1:IMSS-B]|uniref:Ras-related protein Rab-1A, putative n=5 Tax=Entamoeba histolytica TaxID=5759 RepID=B1N372_ENTH1|nr:ras-related protein Rab-1A, putative [Entamoeba histolytica HM-1:IMSS]EMD45979.1 Ras-related protein Rab-1A, putative [Entamoeba histolytica KU27]EMH73103.1 ras-related protein Rab-1A, putative [Entamoeba histolytica HM-1:IMSS-B]EMS12822.1 ras-related protein Rab-1A, putative [Entamoeba histolytica HM-3:IMSS]ENY60774.1 ras-related protein Rab-1A, putative [Entamoeba histolytica HM-1:IMSS-A]EDS89582.1 ras-related protein Rab-1A, putative [Entamoeba histolytica HM-1:IMSS]|eukprot:XP_001913638.1 ras-related protein Rab-1A, putative [Entamoeba histolytica HM-1:IMSS]
MEDDRDVILLKVLLIGDISVGKTSLLLRYCDSTFSTTYITTIGVDFKVATMKRNGRTIKMQIWDTAGSERFRSIVNSYYKASNGCFLVYDITDATSFNNVMMWYTALKEECPECEVMLIGSKSDLSYRRCVQTQTAMEFAKQHQMSFLETSAKEGSNVTLMFQQLVDLMLKNKIPPSPDKNSSISFSKPLTESKNSCC